MNHTAHISRPYSASSPSRNKNLNLGRLGEELAHRYFSEAGFTVLARNCQISKFGELDLIVCDRNTLIAVEVKTRRSMSHGSPLESITQVKLNRLGRLISTWARLHPEVWADRSLRIDGFGVLVRNGFSPKFQHLIGLETC